MHSFIHSFIHSSRCFFKAIVVFQVEGGDAGLADVEEADMASSEEGDEEEEDSSGDLFRIINLSNFFICRPLKCFEGSEQFRVLFLILRYLIIGLLT